MHVDGKAIANTILARLKDQRITATLGVILVGNDPASLSYIKQKQKAADAIGAKLKFEHLKETTTLGELSWVISQYNTDPSVHGLIIQRPVPIPDIQNVLAGVSPKKDIDGFLPNSAFQAPVARAVVTILEHIHSDLREKKMIRDDFIPWLTSQPVAITGRGETAGTPIARLFHNYGCAISIIHSQTPDPSGILQNAGIIISCVGKKEVITKRKIKPGVILISVGLWRDSEGKLHGDYEEDAVKDIAGYFTPTPGGVGPVNVASLMQNLIEAFKLQS